MSDYNNRIKEWITNLVIEELNEDDSWWTSMSADQQADYIKRHPQSQKAQDAKKEKEDEPSHEEIMQHIEDEGYGGDAIGPDGNPTPEAYEDAKQELMYQKQQDAKKEKGDDGGKDDAKPTSDEVDDIKQASDIAKFIEKHENNLNDDEQKYLRDLAQSVLFGQTPPRRAQRYIKQKLGLDKPSPAIQPKTQSKPKQKVAGAADSREVRNNVMNRLGRDQFNKLSYGELQQAYDDEFERLGWKKKGKDYVKQESVEETKKRDYKAEYKKFQSSTKAKKYRAELNKYNRQKGTYGNGDGKDASHKGGKIVGFESQSKNRGRAEKSRLKKESLQENLLSFYQYMGDFYGKKGMYPDKKGRDLKVGDINKALSVYLKKYSKDTFTGDSLDRERVRDILIKMKKIDPQYKKQEVKENRDKIKKYLMSKGDNEKDATDKLRYYDLVKKLYKGSPPAKQAQIMSSLWANEGIEEGKMRPAVKKLLKQKGYSPIFNAIDQSKRQFKQMRYSRGEIQDTLIDMFGDEDPKILQKIKENLNEAVSKSQAQEIMRQLGGRKFEMLMGVKSKGVGKDGLIIHIGRNPKKVSHIIIDLDRGKDLYNIKFGKIYKYKFKIIKNLKGVGVEQMHDVIEKYTGMLTTFRPR